MQMLRDITPEVEAVSIDEAFLDVSSVLKTWNSPVAIARHIRPEVAREHDVTCSVGIGATPVVAKLASTHAKPDGLLLISAAPTVELLHELPVGAFPAACPRTESSLPDYVI